MQIFLWICCMSNQNNQNFNKKRVVFWGKSTALGCVNNCQISRSAVKKVK